MSLGCRARREGDEMYCFLCGLRWARDEEAPPCNPQSVKGKFVGKDGKESNE